MLAGLATASPASISNRYSGIASGTPARDNGTVMPEPRSPNRKALNVRLDADIIARLKRVARDAAGTPCYSTVTSIVEAGIVAECERIEVILASAYKSVAVTQPPRSRRLGMNNHHHGAEVT